jgi:hypothetical protein
VVLDQYKKGRSAAETRAAVRKAMQKDSEEPGE